MSMPISADRWAALRALREAKVPVTHALLAQAAGRGLTAEECAGAMEGFRSGRDHEWLRPTQLLAMQQMLDGEAPTLNRVAAVADISLANATTRGIREGWSRPRIEHWRRRHREALEAAAGTSRVGRYADAPVVIGQPPAAVEPAETNVPVRSKAKGRVAKATAGGVQSREPKAEGPGTEVGRAARVSAMLVKNADQLLTQVELQGGVLTKPQLDAMLAMVRLAEKFEPIAAKEAAANQKKSDAEIAELYDKLDKRLEQRAKYHARRMVARGDFGQGVGTGDGQLGPSGQ